MKLPFSRFSIITWSRRTFFDSHGLGDVDADGPAEKFRLILVDREKHTDTHTHLHYSWEPMFWALCVNTTRPCDVYHITYHVINSCCSILLKVKEDNYILHYICIAFTSQSTVNLFQNKVVFTWSSFHCTFINEHSQISSDGHIAIQSHLNKP